MDDLRIGEVPELDNAILVAAFAGWNDAASAASWAIKFLVNQWDALPFAEVDPDAYYDFTETRPQVRIASGNVRRFSWPAMRFYVHRAERQDGQAMGRDVVLLLGEEPQLRWKAFSRTVMSLCRQCHIGDVALLGALVAEVPHTLPVPISGVSTHTAALRRMARTGVELASYEGPTGILTTLQEASREEGFAATSLWAAAPYYVSAAPNLPAAEALLRTLDSLYGFGLRLQEVARAARRFNQRVSSLVAEDAEVAAYVRELERRAGPTARGAGRTRRPSPRALNIAPDAGDELPSPQQVVEDVEAWLRQFREQSGAD